MLHGIVERLTNNKRNKKLSNLYLLIFIVILFATVGMKLFKNCLSKYYYYSMQCMIELSCNLIHTHPKQASPFLQVLLEVILLIIESVWQEVICFKLTLHVCILPIFLSSFDRSIRLCVQVTCNFYIRAQPQSRTNSSVSPWA